MRALQVIKAQVAIEFLSYSTIFFLAMGLLIAFAVMQGIHTTEYQQYKAAKMLAARIANDAALVASIRNVNITLMLPPTIGGEKYTLTVDGSDEIVEVELNNGIVATHKLPLYTYKSCTCRNPGMLVIYEDVNEVKFEVS